jgi:VanZ family protein
VNSPTPPNLTDPNSPKSPNSPADAGEPASPGANRRPLQGGEELHEAKRSEDGGGEPISHRTTAWPLALTAICLIVYASLYPFTEWRDQGISPLGFLVAPLPQYWTGFDVAANLVGYAPLGFLLALSVLRSSRFSWAVTGAVAAAALLSLTMETLQSYLPSRIPSNVDLVLNTTGAWVGACCAWALEEAGVVGQWSRVRARWFATEARGALVLIALWPVALLFPAAVPLGLGQVFERLEAALADALANSPFLEWLPVRDVELQPLVPLVELVCVALGVLVPCLLAYGVVLTLWRRLVFSVAIFLAGVGASALSAALTYGPDHAWAWLDLPVQVGLGLGAVLALIFVALPRRGAAALALLSLAIGLGLLNQAPADPYFAQTLQTWEQGKFIRFHGVVQWLGWLWPYAAMVYVLVRLSARERMDATEK